MIAKIFCLRPMVNCKTHTYIQYFFIEQTKTYLYEHIDSTNFPFTLKAFKGNDLLTHWLPNLSVNFQAKIFFTHQSQNVLYKSFSLPDVPQSSKIYQNLRKILVNCKIHIYFFLEQTNSYLFEHIDSTNFQKLQTSKLDIYTNF